MEHKLISVPGEFFVGTCSDCGQRIWLENLIGDVRCPHCGSTEAKWTWVRLQLMGVPEYEPKTTQEHYDRAAKKVLGKPTSE